MKNQLQIMNDIETGGAAWLFLTELDKEYAHDHNLTDDDMLCFKQDVMLEEAKQADLILQSDVYEEQLRFKRVIAREQLEADNAFISAGSHQLI